MDDLLFQAAQYMDEHGKAFGMFEDVDGSVCIVGALRKVCLGDRSWLMKPNTEPLLNAYQRLRCYARSVGIVLEHDDITALSDRILGTKEETVKFMMEAAEWEYGT